MHQVLSRQALKRWGGGDLLRVLTHLTSAYPHASECIIFRLLPSNLLNHLRGGLKAAIFNTIRYKPGWRAGRREETKNGYDADLIT